MDTVHSPYTDIDYLLENQLIGCRVDRILSSGDGGLSSQHPFSWERIMADPKGEIQL